MRFDAGIRSTEWLRLELSSGQHVQLTAQVGGAELPAILDSGATITVIDRAWADRLGLGLREGFHADGLTGGMSGQYADDISVRIGSATFDDLTIGVFDHSALKRAAWQDVGLVLGQDLLGSVVVEIDFVKRRARLHAHGHHRTPWQGRLIELRRTRCRRHALPVSIEGRPPIDAVLDLGSNVPLYLAPDYVLANRLLVTRRTSTTVTAGGEGWAISTIATLSTIGIGGAVIRQPPVVVPVVWNERSPALVGWPILSKFRTVMDLGHDRLWLRLEPLALREPLPKDRSGLGTAWADDGLQIVHVARGSPAENVGLQAGDVIAAVDGKRMTPDYLASQPRLGARPAGTAYMLTMADGTDRRLVLQDYY